MAASNTMTSKTVEEGGYVIEKGTWTSSGGTTTLSITADTTITPKVVSISEWAVSSNGDTAIQVARDAGATVLKMTFTANDGGTYMIKGKGA